MPAMIEKKIEIENFQETLKGSRFDLDYSIDAVVKLSNSDDTFDVSGIFWFLLASFLTFFRFLLIKHYC
jgi:hypothetical protein